MMGQLGKLFKEINQSNTDQETQEAYEQIYISVFENYLSHIQCIRRLHTPEGYTPTGPESCSPTILSYLLGTEPMANLAWPSTPATIPIDKDAEYTTENFTPCFDNYCLICKGVKTLPATNKD
jgi:hypothetical protein